MQNDEKLIELVKKQFLCHTPVKEIPWENFSELNLGIQDRIIEETVGAAQVLKFPLSVAYQKVFLKSFLQNLERQGSVISDCLYEEYARLVALPEDHVCYKHYLEGNESIVLKEDLHLVCEGTTGLRTWQVKAAPFSGTLE